MNRILKYKVLKHLTFHYSAISHKKNRIFQLGVAILRKFAIYRENKLLQMLLLILARFMLRHLLTLHYLDLAEKSEASAHKTSIIILNFWNGKGNRHTSDLSLWFASSSISLAASNFRRFFRGKFFCSKDWTSMSIFNYLRKRSIIKKKKRGNPD